MTMQSGDFVGGLQDAIKQNPVSAALIGMGVLWMFTGGAKLSTATALLSPAARAAATGLGAGWQTSANAVGAVTDGVRSVGSQVVDGVRDTLAQATASVGETATQAYDAAKGAISDSTSLAAKTTNNATKNTQQQAGGLASSIHGNLKHTFERQPLLLGAIGIAIGAGMAAGLPSTQLETEFAGDAADRLTRQAKELASEQVERVTETAKRTLEAVKQEAAAQGLTPAAAKDGAAAVGEKLKTVAQQAARGKSKPPAGTG
ncbi:MAG: hypothetical protein QOF14_5109 [Hyphomicrobiales bacterium]|jgi:hypothetical protein|nr:hypothetical protein [Hyphomicrobiales bacterium]